MQFVARERKAPLLIRPIPVRKRALLDMQGDHVIGRVDRVAPEIRNDILRHRPVLFSRSDHAVVRGKPRPIYGHHLRRKVAAGVEKEHPHGARSAAVLLDIVDRHERPGADELC